MILGLAMFGAGLLSWTLLEYAIHGWMGHIYNTFVTPIHAVHHRDPRAVFAIGTWLPAALVAVILAVAFGFGPIAVFYLGLLAGFAAYEVIHYRIHFSARLTAVETRLRAHHLVHHLRRPKMCLGVTTGFWDRVFGTEPARREAAALNASVSNVPPLDGPSNLGGLISALVSARRSS
jgi:sterol desaturase/sphingolipid hydroxylase (fatty acid hydroxylase superfamily)